MEINSKIEILPGTGNLKCRHCSVCNGYGCIGELPGMGGVSKNKNFQLNCSAWKNIQKELAASGKLEEVKNIKINPSQIRNAPVTGAVENIGYKSEKDFYLPYLAASYNAGFGICVGDGCPDEKLDFGIDAVKLLKESVKNPDEVNAAFFLKPYPEKVLEQRLEKVLPYASYIGIDIDAYNIVTMRNKVHLEKKNKENLTEFTKNFKLPFVVKGVFTQEDLDLVCNLEPEVAFFSNHGGRVENREGSSAEFFVQNVEKVKNHCKEVWIDGGIRSKLDVQTALYYGADCVVIGRPVIQEVFSGNFEKLKKFYL